MDKVIEVITYFAALSIAVERFVQIVKNVPVLTKLFNTTAAVQFLSVLVGFGISYGVGPKYLNHWISNQWLEYLVTGLLVSGGSGFWHDALKILQEFKLSVAKQKEGK